MRARRQAALLLLMLLPAAPAALALEPPNDGVTAERLPRLWCGTFRWLRGGPEQQVVIVFTEIARGDDGYLAARGHGTVRSDLRVAEIDVAAQIDPTTRVIEITETIRASNSGYVTDGTHRGLLAPDLRSMTLRFVSARTGEAGTRHLAVSGCREPSA